MTLGFSAGKVYLVLGGQGTVTVTEGGTTHDVAVSGAPTLYQLRSGPPGRSTLRLAFDSGLQAYAFTFG